MKTSNQVEIYYVFEFNSIAWDFVNTIFKSLNFSIAVLWLNRHVAKSASSGTPQR